uniref:Lipocalin n=1 Tax=Rhipicephalus appendiculatus TaxID=34631 RepID=A0A131Z430_RHIAP
MTTKKIFRALILPALMTCLKCQKKITPFAMNADITQFYARHAKIWTLKTTEYTTATCKVDLVDESTANYTQFDRQYYWIGSRVSNLLDGKFLTEPFTTDNNYNAMKVTQEDSTFSSIEHLLQSHQNYSCGIFKVTVLSPDATKYYDLRVKQTAVESPKPSCIQKFEQLSKGLTVTTLYKRTCQSTRKQSENVKTYTF